MKRSRRRPRFSSSTVNSRCPAVTESAGDSDKCSSISKSSGSSRSELFCIRKQFKNLASGGIRGGGHRSKRGRTTQSAPPEQRSDNDHDDAGNLHQGHGIMKHHGAPGITPEELQDAALESVQNHISTEYFPSEALPFGQPNQKQKIQKFEHRFVK